MRVLLCFVKRDGLSLIVPLKFALLGGELFSAHFVCFCYYS